MGAIKQFAQQCIDNLTTLQLVNMLLDRFSAMEGVNEIPVEKMIHLSNVLECEEVNRLCQVHRIVDADDDWIGV